MRSLRQSRSPRSGFTLIELLVVIAIIGVLAAMVTAAIYRVSAYQQNKRAETTVRKVQKALNDQYAALAGDVKKEFANRATVAGALNQTGWTANVITLANGDSEMAQVLWYKMRLMQEFPVSIAEAGLSATGTALPTVVAGFLKPKSAYIAYLNGANSNLGAGGTGGTLIGNANNLSPLQQQSAICLYMALTQQRAGATFNADNIGAGGKGELSYNMGGGVILTYPVFTDGWGGPIIFERWTVDPLAIADLQQPPYITPATASLGQGTDLEDPFHKIFALNYLKTPNGKAAAALIPLGLAGFPAPSNGNILVTLNLGPVVRSFGQDQLPLIPGQSPVFDGDDILGYRLVIQGQGGN
jgi:prepilin-type N-terminal cleavage/methylation domain-containing protein